MSNHTKAIETQDERYVAEVAVEVVRKVTRRIRSRIPIEWEDAGLVQVVPVTVEAKAAG